MENIKLAIITKDKEYGRALSLALVDVYKTFTVTLYQSEPVHKSLDQFDLVLKDYKDFEIWIDDKNRSADKGNS